jgi:membrane fusion protein (multidrug efflux system)
MLTRPDSHSGSAETGLGVLEKQTPLYKRPKVIIASMILVPVILGTAALFIAHAWTRESTDDAFVDGNIVFMAPRVAGNVIALHVNDNQLVSQGDPLFEIDPSEYQEAVNQDEQTVIADEAKAESQQASYEQSVAHVQTVKAISESTKAGTQQARANAEQLSDDLARNKALAATGVISAQEYDDSSKSTLGAIANLNSKAAQQDSAAAYEAEAAKQVQSAKAQWDSARAAIREAKAALAQAQLQLSYTKVFAPVTGRVTQRSLNSGDYVQAGQQVMALVPTSVWITANFKETQLRHMRPGQPAEIRVDAYPSHILHGHVNSIQAGSGARFSLLPPENATGNFVKIVQRVPVKIVLDEPINGSHVLGPGMSVEPTVIIDQSSRPTIVALILAAIASACAIVCGVMFLKRASSL